MARRKVNNIFAHVAGFKPGRSAFDMSYEKHMTCRYGLIYPAWVQEAIPGDYVEISAQALVRLQPMVYPLMGRITAKYLVFFVPYRLLWDKWEKFITRGKSGNDVVPIPTWENFSAKPISADDQEYWAPILGYTPDFAMCDVESLWDVLGLPIRVTRPYGTMDLLRRAYVQVYNDYFRDGNLQDYIPIHSEDPEMEDEGIDPEDYRTCHWLLRAAWAKDFFTSALPFQQRGTPPAIPLSGLGNAVWAHNLFNSTSAGNYSIQGTRGVVNGPGTTMKANSSDSAGDTDLFMNWMNSNVIDFTNIGTFTIPDLYVAYSVQRFQELQARSGSRYIETLKAHFGVSPNDARLQRSEYIGGCRFNIMISEVVQTSGEIGDTPQGNLAGHGIAAGGSYCGKYRAEEHGIFMGMLYFQPDTGYQQGIRREYTRETTFDFPFPLLSHLSEQPILIKELYLKRGADQGDDDVKKIFGFQGRYNECRARNNEVCTQMRVYEPTDYTADMPAPATPRPASLSFANNSRYFAAEPVLNASFIGCNPRMDVFVVQDEPPFVVQFGNIIKMVRPLPVEPIPGW